MSSVRSFGDLFAQSWMSLATDEHNTLLVVCFLLKILSFLIFHRFSIPAAKQIGHARAVVPNLVDWMSWTNWVMDVACIAASETSHLSQTQLEYLQCSVICCIDSTAGQRSQPASWHHFFLVMFSLVFTTD
jgi:type II secretory pathway component PulM